MPGRAPSAGSLTPSTAMSPSGEQGPEMTLIGPMYFHGETRPYRPASPSFAQHSNRLAILPEDDPRKSGDKCDETYAVCNCDYPSLAGRGHSDRPRRRMCGRRRSRRLCRSQRGRRRRTTRRGSGRRNERNAYEIGPSSWHDGHRRARQHRNQSSCARLCFRRWSAGLPLTL